MKVIGVTGGVGCGKSRVLSYLEEQYDMCVIQADLVARDLIEPEGACFCPIIKLLGKEILSEEGRIDRPRMAAAIFGNEELREKVNDLIHPQVKLEILRRIEQARKAGLQYCVVEAALLLEAGYREFLDTIWYIYASEEVRIRRLMEGRGYSEEKTLSIMHSQLSEEEFDRGCDVRIDNSGAFLETRKQIDRILA